MTVEVIIAVRGELPHNLQRTLDTIGNAPVRIVYDGAEASNVALRKRFGGSVPWQTPRGCGAARHYGITQSSADVMILTDGHMSFPPDAVQKIAEYHASDAGATALSCCRMQSLHQDGTEMDCRAEGGAWLCLKSREVCGEYWALSAKWMDPPAESGPVPAIMGACYGMRREWYEYIGQPLRILEAWGGDEEILSLATHVCGGDVVLLPITVGHIYAAAHTGRDRTAEESWLTRCNRYSIVNAIPMGTMRANLFAWMNQTRGIIRTPTRPSRESFELRDHLEIAVNGNLYAWNCMLARGIVRPPTEAEKATFLKSSRLADDAVRPAHEPPPRPARRPIVTQQPTQDWRSYDNARRPK